MQLCMCLENWLNQPGSPVTLDKITGTAALRVGDITRIEPLHCTFCGGHGEGVEPLRRIYRECSCSVLDQLVRAAPEHVVLDERMNEYHLLDGRGGYRLFYFCPACGGQLPKSRRGDYFTKPSLIDRIRFRLTTCRIQSIDDMYRILGEPDRSIPPGTPGLEGDQVATYTYSKRWNNMEVHVLEQRDGSIQIVCTPKFKGFDD